MGIFRAIGFGIFIVIVRVLIPAVFIEGQNTVVSFLHGARVSADAASGVAASVTALQNNHSTSLLVLPPFPLPQTPSITQ